LSVVIVGIIRRKPVLTHASIVCEGILASVNSVKKLAARCPVSGCWPSCYSQLTGTNFANNSDWSQHPTKQPHISRVIYCSIGKIDWTVLFTDRQRSFRHTFTNK